MEMNRTYSNVGSGFSGRANASFMHGEINSEESVSNVSKNGTSLEGMSNAQKGLYNDIEELFENSHQNMLTASVHMTEAAMNLMETDESFRAEVISALSERVWDSATDGVTPYHGVIEITEEGVTMSTTTVSNYESTSNKDMKMDYATSRAEGAFLTFGIEEEKIDGIASFVSSVKNVKDTNFSDLWLQQSAISAYNSNVSNSYSESLLSFGK